MLGTHPEPTPTPQHLPSSHIFDSMWMLVTLVFVQNLLGPRASARPVSPSSTVGRRAASTSQVLPEVRTGPFCVQGPRPVCLVQLCSARWSLTLRTVQKTGASLHLPDAPGALEGEGSEFRALCRGISREVKVMSEHCRVRREETGLWASSPAVEEPPRMASVMPWESALGAAQGSPRAGPG